MAGIGKTTLAKGVCVDLSNVGSNGCNNTSNSLEYSNCTYIYNRPKYYKQETKLESLKKKKNIVKGTNEMQ